jgi:signal transduction histidine kinase
LIQRFTFDHLVERSGSAPAWLRYGCAFGLVLLDTVLKALLVPLSAGNFRLMTFYPAVILSAWLAGIGPAIAATICCVVAAAYWLPPPNSFVVSSPHDIAALVLFSGVSVLIAAVIETLRRTRRRLAEESDRSAALAAERAQLIDLERRARTDAETANRGKDEFLAMLAHELRTPLSAIATAAQAIQRSEATDSSLRLPIDVIGRQAHHVTRLVDDLLDAGRVMAGKIKIARHPIDLADVIVRSIDALTAARRLDRHDLAVHVESAWVDADADRMEQVIVNLLGNALKYTPPGGSITISLRNDSRFVEMAIEDDGIGIPAELLPRVFDLFVQGQHGRQESRGGLGIGLALVRRLVELHGGTVEASAGENGGSVFTVRVPALAEPAARAASFTSLSGSCYQRSSSDVVGGPDVESLWRDVPVGSAAWSGDVPRPVARGTNAGRTGAQSAHGSGAT